MSPVAAVLVLVALTLLLAALGFHALALAPALAAVLLGAIVLRIARRRRRLRHVRIADVSNEARARGADGKAVAAAQAAWMREQGLLTADSVMTAVQRTRAEIVHAGASQARAVLDDLERVAVESPNGVPVQIVAHARLKFDALMRSNIQ